MKDRQHHKIGDLVYDEGYGLGIVKSKISEYVDDQYLVDWCNEKMEKGVGYHHNTISLLKVYLLDLLNES